MKLIKKLKYSIYIVLTLGLVTACGDDDSSAPGVVQIDRMGRPAISTALIQPFTDDNTRAAAENAYNRTHNQNGAGYVEVIANHLAAHDALVDEGSDGNACGDNPFTNLAGTDNSTLATGDDRYNFVATVLADDQLYINGSQTTCAQYLSAEANVAVGAGLNDCGGRAPSYDVIDVSYSILAAGSLSGVSDGVPITDTVSDSTFPYLASPN